MEKGQDWEIPRKIWHSMFGMFYLLLSPLIKFIIVFILFYMIGVIVPILYINGITRDFCLVLIGTVIVIYGTIELLRFRYPSINLKFNKALNGVLRPAERRVSFTASLSYMFGMWMSIWMFHYDVAVLSLMILAFCDPAASTFGTLWKIHKSKQQKSKSKTRATTSLFDPILNYRLSNGKSGAGMLGCFAVAVLLVFINYAFVVPMAGRFLLEPSMHTKAMLIATEKNIPSFAFLSIVGGLIASFSEAITVGSLDDNLTMPLIYGFLFSIAGKFIAV